MSIAMTKEEQLLKELKSFINADFTRPDSGHISKTIKARRFGEFKKKGSLVVRDQVHKTLKYSKSIESDRSQKKSMGNHIDVMEVRKLNNSPDRSPSPKISGLNGIENEFLNDGQCEKILENYYKFMPENKIKRRGDYGQKMRLDHKMLARNSPKAEKKVMPKKKPHNKWHRPKEPSTGIGRFLTGANLAGWDFANEMGSGSFEFLDQDSPGRPRARPDFQA
jgi:hypothetical protein